MVIKYSHNDEWCKHPITDAIKAGCIMIEVDATYDNGKVWASHSKRWFNFLYKGTISDVYLKHLKDRPEIMLYFDIKSDGEQIVHKLASDLMNSGIKNAVYIGGEHSNIKMFIDRYKSVLNLRLFSDLRVNNLVISVDVFGKKQFWMR